MFCSVIIPTIGRDTLEKTIASVLAQGLGPDDLEIIVVNDSGKPLPAAPWAALRQVSVLSTNRRCLSVVRNTGAATARGDYLFFLDDDDWLAPGALAELRRTAERAPEAGCVSGTVQLVDGRGRILDELNSRLEGNAAAALLGGAWVPLQAAAIRADAFFAVGGFDPSIGCTQDMDFIRRLALQADFAYTEAVVGCMLRGEGWNTSTAYQDAPENTRLSREAVVSELGAWKRIQASIPDAYVHGRVLRVYATLALWNLRRGRRFAALSRLCSALRTGLSAGGRLFSPAFRRGLADHHVPGSLHASEESRRAHRSADPRPAARAAAPATGAKAS